MVPTSIEARIDRPPLSLSVAVDSAPLTAPWLALPAATPPPSDEPTSACNEQPPQPFLMRSHYTFELNADPNERARRRKAHRDAIEYRTRRYGRVEGIGDAAWNTLEPKHFAKAGSFFGRRVKMNNRVLSALGCVETSIRAKCTETPYAPEVLDGLRAKNTFHNDEVSNHLFGIAIDVDPNKNGCCGCVPPLSEWPRCKKPVSSPFERTSIPRCWVDAFERYGFYWLGHDVLEDTMHFEFLGDPDKIVRTEAATRGKSGATSRP